ncbi:hypothetical protein HXX76_012753 [Chlamydomonas incerta]|uniref:Right handed beta helix domain-containing protein n=1 Tax=Chlamydomonas incerta TaxID=51695 RepID=A0A835SGV6_CHLIN|nr:hypothetical protein HXX76_012753 [Chlamydomonas incerta]|eukprot:KAG2426968.1 hypothetical protein HXX76_012753 [Chlamydomonas incerta]
MPGSSAISGRGSNQTSSPELAPPSAPGEAPAAAGNSSLSPSPSRGDSSAPSPPVANTADDDAGREPSNAGPLQPPSGLQQEEADGGSSPREAPPPDLPPPGAPPPGGPDEAIVGSPQAGHVVDGGMAPPDAPDAAAPPGGDSTGGGMAGVAYVDRHVTDAPGLAAALEELTRNLTATTAAAAAAAATATATAAAGGGGAEVLRGRIFLAPGVYDLSGTGALRVGLGLELVGGRRAEEAVVAAAAATAAEAGSGAAQEAGAPAAAAADVDAGAGGRSAGTGAGAGVGVGPPAGAEAPSPNSTATQDPSAAVGDGGANRRLLARRMLLQAAAVATHGRTVLDCGGSGEGALVMAHHGFALRDLVFTRCGGAAPVLVDFWNGSSNASSSSSSGGGSSGSPPPGGLLEGCMFEGNTGTVAGGVAVQPGAGSAASLRLAGCVFRNNSGAETPGDYTYDYDYSSGVAQRPVVPASALALGRGAHRVSGCVFEGNAALPPGPPPGGEKAQYNASAASAAVDLSCWQGPASLHIEDSVFKDNTGRQSGAIYLHGHLDGETPSLGCDLALRRVTVARNGGHQAAALLASCPVKGSNCELSIKHTAVVENRTPQSGAVLMRGSGVVFTADNLTLAHNTGGGLGFVDVGTTVTNSRIENNTGTGFGGVSGWGGYFDATNTSFIANSPSARGAMSNSRASANVLSNSYGNQLVNCTFEANRGHALYIYAADIAIRNSRFLRNVFVPGARNSNGGALMLFDLVLLSSIESTLFEGNAAVVGGAVMLYSSQKLSITGCTFRRNYALSGAGLTIDVPVADIQLSNSTFVNNTAFGTSWELLAAAGINVTATAAAATPSPDVAVAVSSPPPMAAVPGAMPMPPAVLPMPYTAGSLSSAAVSDYESDADAAASSAVDYGSGSSSSSSSSNGGHDISVDSILAPPESCGAGGGGGLCVRGAQGVPVSLANVSLVNNTALLGGGLYVGVGSRCLRLAACYRLRLDARVVVTGNRAEMAGGGVHWEYERILQLSCNSSSSSGADQQSGSGSSRSSAQQGQAQQEQEDEQTATRLRLAAPAWPGLLRQLQAHTFAPLSASAGTFAAAGPPNNSTATAATPLPNSSLAMSTQAAPPPSPASLLAADGGGSSGSSGGAAGLTGAAAVRAYLRRVIPCATWAGNTVGAGGYGPTVASTVFFHQPLLLPAASPVAASRSSTAVPPPPPQPQPQLAQPVAAARRSLRQLLQLAGSAAAAAVAAVAPPLTLQPPPSAPPPLPASAPPPMFESGAALPVVVDVFDFYGQKVTRSVIDSQVLIMCTSLNALGQKAAQAEAGTADFSQLRLRDQVNASYELKFEGRTSIRQLGPVGLAVALRPCRINEELSAEGDFCSPCSQDFYSYGGAGGCRECPDGATCSDRGLGGVLVPQDGYWHSAALSANVIECPYEGACQYGGRLQRLADAQAAIIASSSNRSRSSSSSSSGGNSAAGGGDDEEARYRQLQCAEGYWGNLCGSCLEGYGRQASGGCQRCRTVASRVGWVALAFAITFISVVAAVRAALTPEYLQVAAAESRRSRHAVVALSSNTYNTVSTPAATPGAAGDGPFPSPGERVVGGDGGGSNGVDEEGLPTPAKGPTAAMAPSPRRAAELGGAVEEGAGAGGGVAAAATPPAGPDDTDDAGGPAARGEDEDVPLGQLSGERFAAALFRIHGGSRGRRPAAGSAGSHLRGASDSSSAADLQPAQDVHTAADAAPAEAAADKPAVSAAAPPLPAPQSGSVLAAAPSSSSHSGSWHQLFSLATPKSRIQLLKRPWERAAGALTATQSRGRRSAPLSADDMSEAAVGVDAEAADTDGGGGGSMPVSQEAAAAFAPGNAGVRGDASRRGGGGEGGGLGPTSADSVSGSFASSAVSVTAASGSQQQHAPMLGMLPAYGKVSFASLLMAVRATKQPSVDGPGGAGGGENGPLGSAARTKSGRPASRSGSLIAARASGVGDTDSGAAGGVGLSNSSSRRSSLETSGAPRRRSASRFAVAAHAATAVQDMRKHAAATAAARAAGAGAGADAGDDSGGPSASAPGRLSSQRLARDTAAAAAANVKPSASKWHKRRASHNPRGRPPSFSVFAAAAKRLFRNRDDGGDGAQSGDGNGARNDGESAAAADGCASEGGASSNAGGSVEQSFSKPAAVARRGGSTAMPGPAPDQAPQHSTAALADAAGDRDRGEGRETGLVSTADVPAGCAAGGPDPVTFASDDPTTAADADAADSRSAGGKGGARSWGAAAAAALYLRSAEAEAPLTPRTLAGAHAAIGPASGAAAAPANRNNDGTGRGTSCPARAARAAAGTAPGGGSGCSGAGGEAPGGEAPAGDEAPGGEAPGGPLADLDLGENLELHRQGPQLVSEAREAATPPAAAAVAPTLPAPPQLRPLSLTLAGSSALPHSALSTARRGPATEGSASGGPVSSRPGGGRTVSFAAGTVSPVASSSAAATRGGGLAWWPNGLRCNGADIGLSWTERNRT